MTTIPEEAVFAAAKAITGPLRDPTEWELMQFKLAITAALPHLPRVGVKKLEWELVSGDHYAEGAGTHYNIYETKPGLWNSVTVKPGNVRLATNVGLEAAKSAAQSDYEARILSALEPSAARELALEALRSAEQFIENGFEFGFIRKPDEGDPALETLPKIKAAIRAISSPDHADAGKVEGDEKKWPMREIVAKAIAYHSVGDPHAKTIRGDQRWEWFLEEADNFISVFGCYLPPLPSAQSEGAE